CPQPVQSQSLLQPVSPLPAPSPYASPTGGLAERRAPASRPASPARPACTHTRWHCVLPLLLCVSRCRLLLRPLFLPFLTRSLTPFVLPVLLLRASWLPLSLNLLSRPLLRLP
ncbi:unnamed protein product, partial [Closterium sp. NIES-53]